jgi:hypothetical protein
MVDIDHRHHRDGPSMDHNLTVGDRPIAEPDRLQREVHLPTSIDYPTLG